MRSTLLVCLGVLAQAVLVAAALAQPCTQAPPAPTGLDASQFYVCSVRLQWNAVAGADSYEVWMGPPAGETGAAVLLATSATPEFLDTRPLSNQHRPYWVKAVNACGVSALSDVAYGWAVPGTPYLPISLSVSSTCDRRLYVSWRTNAPLNGSTIQARVWRTLTPEFTNPTLLTSVIFRGFDLYDSSVLPGVPYWYWVQAYRQPCDSPVVGGVRGMVDPNQQPPRSVSASYRSMCRAIRVTWSADCPDSFALFRSTSNDPATATLVGGVSRTAFVDTQVEPFVPYYYWVRATGLNGQSVLAGPAVGEAGDIPPTAGFIGDQDIWPGGVAEFYASASSSPPELTWQWYSEGVLLEESTHYSGTTSNILYIIDVTEADARTYYAVATNPCGSTETNAARLNVGDFPFCSPSIADYNYDGGVDGGDIQSFFIDWEQSAYCADVNRDGGVDGQDIEAFITCWESC